jgi:hypothetical protein
VRRNAIKGVLYCGPLLRITVDYPRPASVVESYVPLDDMSLPPLIIEKVK